MQKRPKSPRMTTLELLLLAILKRGPATNYFALERQWGLSIGTTHPALAKLRKANLVEVKASTGGKAGSISLTRRGQQALDAGWRTCFAAARGPEGMIRAVTVAALLGTAHEKRQAAGAAREAAARRKSAAAKRRVDVEDFSPQKSTPLGLHRWMAALLDSATWEAQAAVLEEIARELEGTGQEVVDSSDIQKPKPEAAPDASIGAEYEYIDPWEKAFYERGPLE
jgi:DNA-binding MarR family transcriptional regulator